MLSGRGLSTSPHQSGDKGAATGKGQTGFSGLSEKEMATSQKVAKKASKQGPERWGRVGLNRGWEEGVPGEVPVCAKSLEGQWAVQWGRA